jgi:homopolymeric O-antigen transport system permease protein
MRRLPNACGVRAGPGRDLLRLCREQRRLIVLLAGREIADRFADSVLGAFWAVLHPIFTMLLYVLVFGTLLRLRMPAEAGRASEYALFFIAGYLPWMALQDAAQRGAGAILSNANLVKQVVFPLEVLPLKTVLACTLSPMVGVAFLLAYRMISGAGCPATVVLLPALLVVQLLGMAGIALALAALSVFLRDIKEGVHMLSALGLYLLPVLYVPGSLPRAFETLLTWNPVSHLVWMYQDVLFYGAIAHPMSWVIGPAFAIAVFVVGHRLFFELKPYFGNCL